MKITRALIAIAVAVGVLAILMMYVQRHPQSNAAHTVHKLVPLRGNTMRLLSYAHLLGPAAKDKVVTVTLGLTLRNEDELNKLIARQSDPASPDYQKYLTVQQFIDQYSPTQDDYDRLVSYLSDKKNGAGLTVVRTAPNRLIIVVQGTIKQMESAFSVKVNRYRLRGQLGFSNASDPMMPDDLRGLVQSVSGLNSFAKMRNHMQKRSGLFDFPWGYSPGQIARAYNYPNANNITAAVKHSGKAVTIAIITQGAFDISDVRKFWKSYGISRTEDPIAIPVGSFDLPKDVNDETTVDVEWSGAQAPDAHLLVYETADTDSNTFAIAFNEAVCGVPVAVDSDQSSRGAHIISISWGACEAEMGVAEMQRDDNIFKEACAQGIAVFVASGDNGAYDCYHPRPPESGTDGNGDSKPKSPAAGQQDKGSPQLSIDSPASDPFVTAIGGTTLRLNDDGTLRDSRPESAWVGTGGGVSMYFKQPDWQNGPGVPQNGMRNTSDMALAADPLFSGYSYLLKDEWGAVGGTSLGAPNMAAAWALLEETAGKRIGGVNPLLYRIGRSAQYANVFHDITTGSNGNGVGTGYAAGSGWDHPTGWGVPDVTQLINWVLQNGTAPQAVPSAAPLPSPVQPPAVSSPSASPAPVNSPSDRGFSQAIPRGGTAENR